MSKENQQIQYMQEADYNFTCLSYLKRIKNKCMKNQLVSQIDLFSLPIKLNIDGSQEFKTVFGGLTHFGLIIGCLVLTYFAIYPDGFALNSSITQSKIIEDYGNDGSSIFQHTTELISVNAYLYNGSGFAFTSVKAYMQIFAFQKFSSGRLVSLDVSTNCKYGEFCLKDSSVNHDVALFGSPYNPQNEKSDLVFQFVWCETTNVSCPAKSTMINTLVVKYSNFYKQKNLILEQFKEYIWLYYNTRSTIYQNVSRETFSSNSKAFGHLSNFLPSQINSYKIEEYALKTTSVNDFTSLSGFSTVNSTILTYTLSNSGYVYLTVQNFDDIITPILLFLSVKQTLYFLVFMILVREYNKNSGFLRVGAELFYINDFTKKKMYNFNKGYQVFLACFLRNHFIFKSTNFILMKFGKTLFDYLPNKSICAISLMNKAEQLLQQNIFYKKLNDLSLMQNQVPRKISYVEKQENQENQQIDEQSNVQGQFFQDSNMDQKQKTIYKNAFEQFCQDNGYVSTKRKRQIYQVLTNTKLKHILAFEMQKQFKNYVKNAKVQEQAKNNEALQMLSQESNEIKIQVHDMSNNQFTAAQLMQGKRKDSF